MKFDDQTRNEAGPLLPFLFDVAAYSDVVA
jgi:hypothetical protein